MAHFQLEPEENSNDLSAEECKNETEATAAQTVARPDLVRCLVCNTELTKIDIQKRYPAPPSKWFGKTEKKKIFQCALCHRIIYKYMFECSNSDCTSRATQGGYCLCMNCSSADVCVLTFFVLPI